MNRLVASAATLLLAIASSLPVQADDHVSDIAKYRHSIMELLAGHMNALSLIAQGKVEQGAFTQNHASAIASALAEVGALFPAGSGGDGTHALPAIWEDPEDFETAVRKAREAGAALGEVASGEDRKAFMGAFSAVGKSCKGCHESYREEHDH